MLDRAINRKQMCVWVAPSIPTARGHWEDLVKLVEGSGIPVKKITQASKQIIFADGGQIIVRSAVEPDNMRGITADYIVMDEAAFFRGGEYVWFSVVMPMVTASGGVVLFTSTPNGRNWFWQLFSRGINPKDTLHKSWHAPSTVSPYQDKKLLAALQESMPEYQWREEFLAEFLADGSGVFSGAQEAAIVPMLNDPEDGHSYVAGIDFGFNHDATVFTVIDKYTRRQVYGKRFFNFGTAGTIRQLVQLMNQWKPEVTHLEKNGVGESLFEILKGALDGKDDIPDVLNAAVINETVEGGEDTLSDEVKRDRNFETSWHGRIKAIHMDNHTKRTLVERLAADIEYKRLETLTAEAGTYGEIQLNEMSTYERQRTQSGLDITYNATEGSYDDTVSGLYLANKGMPRPKPWMHKNEVKGETKNPFKSGSRRHMKGGRDA